MRFNIIGAGRLGKNLALSLMSRAGCELVAVCNRQIDTACLAVTELGSGMAVEHLADLPPVDMTFITTPDDCITNIAKALSNTGGIVAHCSGALGSDVLASLKEQGCLIASIHPLKPFRKNDLEANALQDCDCVIEGDERAVDRLTLLFTEMGAQVIRISSDKKRTYHAAAVMAANYLITLADCAIELFMDADLSERQAKDMTERLMQSSLTNLHKTNHAAEALTGPLARGDLNTVKQHLKVIHIPHIDALYRAAGLATLRLTHLDPPVVDDLRTCLNAR